MREIAFGFTLLCVCILGNMGCSPLSSTSIERAIPVQQDTISIESRNCDRITAILPNRGRYDGISMEFLPAIERWELKFEHVAYRNERPSPIGLLSLEEIAEITSLIINRGECANPPYATRTFKTGDKFHVSIDWWLVDDLYTTGLEAARLIPQNYGGPMMIKPINYKEVSEAFKSKGFVGKFCRVFEQADHACVKKGCEFSEDKACQPQWYSMQKPFFSSKVKDVSMDEVCKVENCGLEKESKFSLELVKL